MTIKIYHAKRARSARVIWLLEELGVPYELETLEFKPEALQSPEYLQVHPLGQLPAVRDGELTLIESGGILEYLLDKHGEGGVPRVLGLPQRRDDEGAVEIRPLGSVFVVGVDPAIEIQELQLGGREVGLVDGLRDDERFHGVAIGAWGVRRQTLRRRGAGVGSACLVGPGFVASRRQFPVSPDAFP